MIRIQNVDENTINMHEQSQQNAYDCYITKIHQLEGEEEERL